MSAFQAEDTGSKPVGGATRRPHRKDGAVCFCVGGTRRSFDASGKAGYNLRVSAPEYEVHPLTDLPERAAVLWEAAARGAVAARGIAHIALSGGTTPRALFRLLASEELQARLPWAESDIWWVDERCVPPDHHDSNYGAAHALLLGQLPLSIAHRMHGELAPQAAADAYEAELRHHFALGPHGHPRFDLILLGMGADGHTASLFPGTPAVTETRRLVTVGRAPDPPHERLSLTLPVLNRAALVLFLVTGANKGPALRQIFFADPPEPVLPAALVQPARGRLLWLLDETAAEAAGL